MPLFAYQALSAQGTPTSGEIEAESERSARRTLQLNGVYVMQLRKAGGGQFLQALKQVNIKQLMALELTPSRLPQRELVAFTRQFATLISANIPVVQALDSLLEQTEQRGLKRLLQQVRTRVNEGQSLGDALALQKGLPQFYVPMVQAAEASGKLGMVLEELADLMEKRARIAGQVRGAMTYPVFMLVVGTLVVAYLLTSVVPNITAMYADTNRQLPAATVTLIAISDFLRHAGFALLVLLAACGVLFSSIIKRNDALKTRWHGLQLSIPLFGDMLRKGVLARFSGVLAALLGAGVPIVKALSMCANLMPYLPYRTALQQVAQAVGEGRGLAESLKEHGNLFPPMLVHMTAVGEKSGKVEDMLHKVAAAQTRELEDTVNALTSLIQPALLLLMGGLIAFIMVAILMPIFELNTAVGG